MKKILLLLFLMNIVAVESYSQSITPKGGVSAQDIDKPRPSGLYTLSFAGSHSEAFWDVSGLGGSTPRFQFRFHYGDRLYFRAARDKESNWDKKGFREILTKDERGVTNLGGNIMVGSPNNSFGFKKGLYSIGFYGYRDIFPNVISAKISAERTLVCCNWKYQGTDLAFYTSRSITKKDSDLSIERMRIKDNGNVGIGTSTPDSKLTVKGTIHAQEVKVDLLGSLAPDYVFEPNYALLSLDSLSHYIEKNKHLPGIPSAKEMSLTGLDLKTMNMHLLEKVEELTLYILSQEEKIKEQQIELKQQRDELITNRVNLNSLSSRIKDLENLIENLR